MQNQIDANTWLTVAVGRPTPDDRHDAEPTVTPESPGKCHCATVMADARHQGNPDVLMPYRAPGNGSPPASWKYDLNTVHKRVRPCVEYSLAHIKTCKVLRNCRRKRDGVWYAACGVAQTSYLAMTDLLTILVPG